jgi:hypothetical protein
MSQQINLLNRGFAKKAFSFTSARAMVYGVSMAVSLTAIVAVIQAYRARAVEAEAARVARVFKETTAAQAVPARETPRKADPSLELKVRALEAQLKGRQDIVDAMRNGLIGSSDGFSEYMRVFSRQNLDGLWLTGFDVAAGGEELTIAGRALTADLVPVYLQRLNRETSIQGRQFTSMLINQPKLAATNDAATSYVEFRVASGAGEDVKRAGSSQPTGTAIPPRPRADDAPRAFKGNP